MAFALPSRVYESFTTTGTGTITLGGAVSGYRTFASALSNGDTVFYVLQGGADWEIGYGTYTGGTLARTTVLKSSNSNNAVDWAAGTKYASIAPLGPSDLDATNLGRLQGALGISSFIQTLIDDTTAALARGTLELATSTTDNAIARYDSTAGKTQNSAATVDDTTGGIKAGSFVSTPAFSISDDAVQSITLSDYVGTNQRLALLLSTPGGSVENGLFRFISNSTNTPAAVGSAMDTTNVNFSSSVLTGTTGTDGKLTISVNSGVMYIENRRGSGVIVKLIFFGG